MAVDHRIYDGAQSMRGAVMRGMSAWRCKELLSPRCLDLIALPEIASYVCLSLGNQSEPNQITPGQDRAGDLQRVRLTS